MQKRERATVPEEEKDAVIADMFQKWKDGDPVMRQMLGDNVIEAQSRIHKMVISEYEGCEVYLNDIYQVAKYPEQDGTIHLSIKRIDREPVTDWRDKQEIKNQLVGPDHEAVELYPAEDRVVDCANQYHLWVSADPKYRIPIGWHTGARMDEPIGKSKQRKR